MKKVTAILLVAMLLMAVCAPMVQAKVANRKPGGVPGFLCGCCLGLRTGLEWNDGAELHWREWAPVIPWVGFIFSIWNGLDCYGGTTPKQWAEQNGANWY